MGSGPNPNATIHSEEKPLSNAECLTHLGQLSDWYMFRPSRSVKWIRAYSSVSQTSTDLTISKFNTLTRSRFATSTCDGIVHANLTLKGHGTSKAITSTCCPCLRKAPRETSPRGISLFASLRHSGLANHPHLGRRLAGTKAS